MHATSPSARRAPRLALLVAFLLSLVAALGLLPSSATAADTAPALIVIDSVSSGVTPPTGTPSGAVPSMLVKAGQPFSVHVSFYTASGAPAAFNNDTTLTVTSDKGTTSPGTGVALAKQTSATLTTSLPAAANQVALTVAAAGKAGRTVQAGHSTPTQLFDVVSQLRFENSSLGFQKGIGGDSDCSVATASAPVCGIVVLPNGAVSSNVLLSLGACDTVYAGCSKGAVVQTLADLSGLYTKTSPATMIVKCDKSLCGGGSISSQKVSYSLMGNDALKPTEACPAKSTIGAGQDACVDYVQSKRDGSGDTYFYFLFTQDARISTG